MTKSVDGARQSGWLSGAPNAASYQTGHISLKVSNRLPPSAGHAPGCGVGPLRLSARLVGGARRGRHLGTGPVLLNRVVVALGSHAARREVQDLQK